MKTFIFISVGTVLYALVHWAFDDAHVPHGRPVSRSPSKDAITNHCLAALASSFILPLIYPALAIAAWGRTDASVPEPGAYLWASILCSLFIIFLVCFFIDVSKKAGTIAVDVAQTTEQDVTADTRLDGTHQCLPGSTTDLIIRPGALCASICEVACVTPKAEVSTPLVDDAGMPVLSVSPSVHRRLG